MTLQVDFKTWAKASPKIFELEVLLMTNSEKHQMQVEQNESSLAMDELLQNKSARFWSSCIAIYPST